MTSRYIALLSTLALLAGTAGTACSGAGTRADGASPADAGQDTVPIDQGGGEDGRPDQPDPPLDRLPDDQGDALPADGPDGPTVDMPALRIGLPCTDDTVNEDCGVGASCLVFRPGYAVCSLPTCDLPPEDSCPAGSTCNNFGGADHFCLRNCTPGASGGDCPADNFVCEFTEAANCLPGCETASDCTKQFGTPKPVCLAQLGGLCRTDGLATAAVGEACQTDDQCPRYGTCVRTGSFPSGYCTILGCDLDPTFACAAGSACATLEGTLSQQKGCVKLCSVDGDCRTGYRCLPLDGAAGGDGGSVLGCRPGT